MIRKSTEILITLTARHTKKASTEVDDLVFSPARKESSSAGGTLLSFVLANHCTLQPDFLVPEKGLGCRAERFQSHAVVALTVPFLLKDAGLESL